MSVFEVQDYLDNGLRENHHFDNISIKWNKILKAYRMTILFANNNLKIDLIFDMELYLAARWRAGYLDHTIKKISKIINQHSACYYKAARTR